MPARVLNEKFVLDGLVCPPGKTQIEYTDADRTGLYIEVRATSPGQGTYWYRYKADSGKTARIKIGRTIDISVQEAKAKVKTLRAKVQLGDDPAAEKREKRQVPTWDTFFKDYYLPHAQRHKRSWRNDEEMHRLRISANFGSTKLNGFSRLEVQQWLNELSDTGLAASTVSHHGKLLRQALNLAVSWDLLEKNPIAGIKLPSVDNRIENVLTSEQLQELMEVLHNVSDRRKVAALAILFSSSTGARVNEALHARWSDVSREYRTWTVQATNSKSKRRRSIPLNDTAIAILDELASKGKSEWLFTSSRGDGTQRMTTINKLFQQLRKEAGLPWLRLHDLRHNYASMLVNSGRTLYEVQRILGHSDSKVTERYSHLSTATLQDAANSASDCLEKALEKPGNFDAPSSAEQDSAAWPPAPGAPLSPKVADSEHSRPALWHRHGAHPRLTCRRREVS